MTNPEFIYTTYIKTTTETIWNAITNPEFTRQYWNGCANISDWQTGSKWEHIGTDNDVWIMGDILESIPPKQLVLTWVDPDNLSDSSKVIFEIEPLQDGIVRLMVRHYDFKSGSDMQGKVSEGWPRVLSSLKSFIETG